MKTSQSPRQNQGGLAPRTTETRRLNDLDRANLVTADINFFDKYRTRGLGGQVAEKAAEAAVRRLTPRPLDSSPPLSWPTHPEANPKVDQAPKPAETVEGAAHSVPVDLTRDKEIALASTKEPTWLGTVKWLTRLFLSLFFLVWIFVLGVIVGRASLWDYPTDSFLKTGPLAGSPPVAVTVEPQTPKADLEKTAKLGDVAQGETPSPTLALDRITEPEDELNLEVGEPQIETEPEADLAESYSQEELDLAEEPGATSLAETQTPKSSLNSLASPLVAAAAVAKPPKKESSPTPKAKEAARNDSLSDLDRYWPSKPQGQGGFTVQVATAKSMEEAKKFVEKYQKLAFKAYYYEKSHKNYPVRVGRFATMSEAETAKNQLARAGAKQPYVSKLNN